MDNRPNPVMPQMADVPPWRPKLLTWLIGLIFRCRQRQRRQESAREIFVYRDGAKERRIDPLVAWRRFNDDPQLDPSIHFDQLDSDEIELKSEATVIVSNAARRMFDLVPFNENDPASVVDSEAMGILWLFLAWVDAQKKSTETLPTSQHVTADT